MISKIEFIRYSDYPTADANLIKTYTQIFDFEYPEKAFNDSVSWFSCSPSSLKFSLNYDTWLRDYIYSNVYDAEKNYLNQFVVLAYEDAETVPFFTGCILVSNITVNDDENIISIQGDNFLMLFNRISDMVLNFKYETQTLAGQNYVAEQPFIADNLGYINKFLNFAVLIAETEFWGWGSYVIRDDFLSSSGTLITYPGSEPLWNLRFLSSTTSGNVYSHYINIYKNGSRYNGWQTIRHINGTLVIDTFQSYETLATLESLFRTNMQTYGATSYKQTYLLDGDNLYYLEIVDTEDPVSHIANGNYQTSSVYTKPFLADYKIKRELSFIGNDKIKYSGILENYNNTNKTLGIGYKKFAYVENIRSGRPGVSANGNYFYEYTYIGGNLTYEFDEHLQPVYWGDGNRTATIKHKLKTTTINGENATIIYFGLRVEFDGAVHYWTTYEQIRTFIGYSEIISLNTEKTTYYNDGDHSPDWWNDVAVIDSDTGAVTACVYVIEDLEDFPPVVDSLTIGELNISLIVNDNIYSSVITNNGVPSSSFVTGDDYFSHTVNYSGTASNTYFNYQNDPTIEAIMSNIMVINNCYYRCDIVPNLTTYDDVIYVRDRTDAAGVTTFAISADDMIGLNSSRILEEDPVANMNFDIISLDDSKNLILPIQQFYNEFYKLIYSSKSFELSCIFTDYLALGLDVDSIFSYDSLFYVINRIQKLYDNIYKIEAYNIQSTKFNRILSTNGTLSYQGILSIDGITANITNWIVGK